MGIIKPMKRAIFLDRDGVIIENRPAYVLAWDDVQIYPQALTALQRINSTNFMIIIITNQSPIGRGLISLSEAEQINRRLLFEIAKNGGRIDEVLMCPHAPEEGCSCRKPLPGLFYEAAAKLGVNLKNSYMVGDAVTDLVAAMSAGVGELILVQTGRGSVQQLEAERRGLPFKSFTTLLEAVEAILCE